MESLATAMASRARGRGFTLMELIAVVAIVAVFAAMLAIVAAPGEAALADREARRLSALLELALAEARASGKEIAWTAERGGYSFWQRAEDGEWIRFPDSSIYRRRTFEGKTEITEVLLDARELRPGERVPLSRYGLLGSLKATIAGGDTQVILLGSALGRISLQRISGPRLHAG